MGRTSGEKGMKHNSQQALQGMKDNSQQALPASLWEAQLDKQVLVQARKNYYLILVHF